MLKEGTLSKAKEIIMCQVSISTPEVLSVVGVGTHSSGLQGSLVITKVSSEI